MAPTIEKFLNATGVRYHLVPASHARTAICADLLADRRGVVLAVFPCDRELDVAGAGRVLGRDLDYARPGDIARYFEDCDQTSLPPFGEPYGIDSILDASLHDYKRLMFPSGRAGVFVAVSGDDFALLQVYAIHGATIASQGIAVHAACAKNA